LLSALTALADPNIVPRAATLLDESVRCEYWDIAAAAAEALGSAGTAAAAALPTLRELTARPDWSARSAALVALQQIGADDQEILDLLHAHLTGPSVFHDDNVATVLRALGPAAAALTPLLQERLSHRYEWTRVLTADALWAVAGEPHAQTIIDVLLQAWDQNQATASYIVTVLDRMGTAAAPALPHLRAELARTRRGGRFGTIDTDEDLTAMCRTLINRLG